MLLFLWPVVLQVEKICQISTLPGQSDIVLAHPSYINVDDCVMWEQIFALDEGEPHYVCTIHEIVTVLYAM